MNKCSVYYIDRWINFKTITITFFTYYGRVHLPHEYVLRIAFLGDFKVVQSSQNVLTQT